MGTYKYAMRDSCDGGKHGQQYMEYDAGGWEYPKQHAAAFYMYGEALT